MISENVTKVKHSPGPWAVVAIDHLTTGDHWCCDIIPEGPNYRGGVAYLQSHEHINGQTVGETQANAALIAAAPDLLEACRRVAEFDGQCIYGTLDVDEMSPREAFRVGSAIAFERCVSLVRSAIAKATGTDHSEEASSDG
jgi:hypothetical protein